MEARGSLLTGIGAGAALAYFFDPARGRRRRTRVRDLAAHGANVSADGIAATARDVANRTYGTAALLGRAFRREQVDDRVLIERVRAVLGRVVAHPHAIDVSAIAGYVSLSGPILKAEVKPLLNAVRRTRGVRDVINNLDAHKTAEGIPALQGGRPRPKWRADGWQRQWSPATRVLTGLGGASLVSYGASRRDIPGMLIAAGGAGLLARSTTNVAVRRLVGAASGRRAVDIQKDITVDAPVDEVFAFWTCYENFPRFMSRVLEVRPSVREGQSHWTVLGPAGIPVEFDAEITEMIPNQVFAWRTVEGSAIAHAGHARFDPTADGGTRLTIRMSYNPPGGWIGHGVAAAFGVDPKSSLDADLARVKTLIETGRPPRDATRPDVL